MALLLRLLLLLEDGVRWAVQVGSETVRIKAANLAPRAPLNGPPIAGEIGFSIGGVSARVRQGALGFPDLRKHHSKCHKAS